jgi:twitching motility protein PilT
VAAVEILVHDYAVANMIREDKLHQLEAHLQTASPDQGGMQSLDRCLLGLVRRRLIDPEEALRMANVPETMAAAINELPREAD